MTSELETRVRSRLDSLTKPVGSLGALEDIALRYACIRGEDSPSSQRKGIYVFCGDHGLTEEGVSPYPQEVTRQMMLNFVAGGAAINVMARHIGISPVVVDVGAKGEPVPGAQTHKIASGTRNFAKEPAMTREQAQTAIEVGARFAEEASSTCDVVALGEMGIGNTTAAAALLTAFIGCNAQAAIGPGAGLSPGSLSRKASVVANAIALHRPDPTDGLGVLAALGGFEIAAIAGFVLRASELRLPVILDGFPCCSAALVVGAIRPDALKTVFFSHLSPEPGHRLLLDSLRVQPYLSLGMRLGEGTGAALMMNLIDISVKLLNEMATFDGAGVSSRTEKPGGVA